MSDHRTPPSPASPHAGSRNVAATFIGRTVPAVDAATVLLLRDAAPDLLEVLMVQRHRQADFAGGALVFPGGKVAEVDRALSKDLWAGADLAAWSSLLGGLDEERTLGFLVAAVRETFEEAGVLLATRHGRPVDPDLLVTSRFQEVRAQLVDREQAFDWRDWLLQEELVLDLGKLELWAWWITPEGQHKRFDTRFFAARLPEGQVALHDTIETTSLRWGHPSWALAEHAASRAKVIFPTRRVLRSLEQYAGTAEALEAARSGVIDRRPVQPSLRHDNDGQLWVYHPYDGTAERL